MLQVLSSRLSGDNKLANRRELSFVMSGRCLQDLSATAAQGDAPAVVALGARTSELVAATADVRCLRRCSMAVVGHNLNLARSKCGETQARALAWLHPAVLA
jgi:hypothetical protein